MNAVDTSKVAANIAQLEEALAKRMERIARQEAELRAIRDGTSPYDCSIERIAEKEQGLENLRKKVARLESTLHELRTTGTLSSFVPPTKEETIRHTEEAILRSEEWIRHYEEELLKKPGDVTAKRLLNEHRLKNINRRENLAHLGVKLGTPMPPRCEAPKRKPPPPPPPKREIKWAYSVTDHAIERYLERVVGLTPTDICRLHLLGAEQCGALWGKLAQLVMPPGVFDVQASRQTTVKSRVVVFPGSHIAILDGTRVVTVVRYPAAPYRVPPCLLPYFEKENDAIATDPPVYRIHSPLGLHRGVTVSACHGYGQAAVGRVACHIIAGMVEAEARELTRWQAIEAAARWFDITTQQVVDAMEFMALPPRIRAAWTTIGNWETERYYAQEETV